MFQIFGGHVIQRYIQCDMILPPSHEHTCSFRIVVVKEKTFTCVKSRYSFHILVRKRKIKDINVLPNPLYMVDFGIMMTPR